MKVLYILLAVSCGLISSDAAGTQSTFTESCVCPVSPEKLTCTVYSEQIDGSFPLDKADGTYYTCTCRDGYQQAGNNPWNCEPIDECNLDPHPCPSKEDGGYCVDVFPPKKYTCKCLSGYEEIAKDEQGATICREDTTSIPSTMPTLPAPSKQPSSYPSIAYVCASVCTGNNKECTNNICQCKPGYFSTNGDNVSAHCEDENECQANYTPEIQCDKAVKATCTNTIGSYTCACKDGWRDTDEDAFPGSNCVNIDECAENLHDCDLTQVCLDENPPTKWMCVEKTPAPTPAPTPVPCVNSKGTTSSCGTKARKRQLIEGAGKQKGMRRQRLIDRHPIPAKVWK